MRNSIRWNFTDSNPAKNYFSHLGRSCTSKAGELSGRVRLNKKKKKKHQVACRAAKHPNQDGPSRREGRKKFSGEFHVSESGVTV